MKSKQHGLTSVVLVFLVIVAASCRSSTYETPSPQDIETSLFLIGDAGAPDPREVACLSTP
jgi:hypothetical protein